MRRLRRRLRSTRAHRIPCFNYFDLLLESIGELRGVELSGALENISIYRSVGSSVSVQYK